MKLVAGDRYMSVQRLKQHRLVYVATPYSKYHEGHDAAYKAASRGAGNLMKNGIKVFCPIGHGHGMSVYGGVPYEDHQIWLKLDEAFLDVCDAIAILDMPGWITSTGVNFEIDYMRTQLKPVYMVCGAHTKHDNEAVVWAWSEFAPDFPHLKGR